jgi:hypothetical protein
MKDWRERRHVPALLQARAALFEECERLMTLTEKESRALAADERRAFDDHSDQIREINASLAEYKRAAVAEVVASGYPAEHARQPF